jgi:hypothetical protein
MDAPRSSSLVAGHRRSRSLSSPPLGPPCSALRVNGPATTTRRPLANGHASVTTPLRSGTIAARRGVPPLRLFFRDAGDAAVEPALQALPPPPPSSPPVSPTLPGRGSTSHTARPLLHHRASRTSSFVRAEARAPGHRADASAGTAGTRLLSPVRGMTPPPPERPPEWVGEPPTRPRRW